MLNIVFNGSFLILLIMEIKKKFVPLQPKTVKKERCVPSSSCHFI
jgi:hypothetical protein